jgi:hypothetical protein
MAASLRRFATHASTPSKHFKVLFVGAGSGAITTCAQLLKSDAGLRAGDIGILDASSVHHYQPAWSLVGGGVADIKDYSRPMSTVIPEGATLIPSYVSSFAPESNSLSTVDGQTYHYEWLVVAPGIQLKPSAIEGLAEALEDPASKVSSIYFQQYATKLAEDAGRMSKGKAIFTQPLGAIKCAGSPTSLHSRCRSYLNLGAPQKVMWKNLQRWREAGVRDQVDISFITGSTLDLCSLSSSDISA